MTEAAKAIAFENTLVMKIKRQVNHYLVEKFRMDPMTWFEVLRIKLAQSIIIEEGYDINNKLVFDYFWFVKD